MRKQGLARANGLLARYFFLPLVAACYRWCAMAADHDPARIFQENNARREAVVMDHEPTEFDADDGDPEGEGPVWDYYLAHDLFLVSTGFGEEHLRALVAIASRCYPPRGRGRARAFTVFDDVVLYITMLRSGFPLKRIAEVVLAPNLSLFKLTHGINRARVALHEALTGKWWDERPRPTALPREPQIGLIVDSISLKVYHPYAPYEEAKVRARTPRIALCLHASV